MADPKISIRYKNRRARMYVGEQPIGKALAPEEFAKALWKFRQLQARFKQLSQEVGKKEADRILCEELRQSRDLSEGV